MSFNNKVIGKVTPEQRDEIQALFDRRNSLKELFSSVPASNNELYERVIADMAQTQKKFDQWWADRSQEYNWESKENCTWNINFETCEILLVKNPEFFNDGFFN